MFNGLKSLKKAKYLYLALGLVAVVGLGFALGSIHTRENSASQPRRMPRSKPPPPTRRPSARHAGESLSEAQNKPVITRGYPRTLRIRLRVVQPYTRKTRLRARKWSGWTPRGSPSCFGMISTSIDDGDGAHVKLSIDQVTPQRVMLRLEGGKCVICNVLGTDTMQAQQEFTIDTRKWDGRMDAVARGRHHFRRREDSNPSWRT